MSICLGERLRVFNLTALSTPMSRADCNTGMLWFGHTTRSPMILITELDAVIYLATLRCGLSVARVLDSVAGPSYHTMLRGCCC